jgi:hypothetical protein
MLLFTENRRTAMARPRATETKAGRKKPTLVEAEDKQETVERASFTIAEFCVAHRISESFYFKIRGLGLGPRELRKLDKILITKESAAEWRAANPLEPAA